MKKIIYILSAIILLSSCKSIDKMVESGRYDEALRFGVDKLRGEKNKKTKYVKGLEKAYLKLNLQDQNEVNHLALSGMRNSHDRIVDIYTNMEKRQNYIMPLLPLISEDGYLAEIKIIDYSVLINKASIAASEKHYAIALKHLQTARKVGNKTEARKAYEEFEEAQYYFSDYKESYNYKKEAYELGQSRILVESYARGSNMAFDHTIDIISQINISKLNNKWEKFYTQDNDAMTFNYIATLEVIDIVPGRERERINSFTETKKVIDGRKKLIDRTGKVVRDTSGNPLYLDKMKEVSAYISEIEREKIAHMNGRLIIIEAIDNMHINTIPINITHEFRDYACSFQGDKRALSDSTSKKIKSHCDPFPTDYEITSTMAYTYKSVAEKGLNTQYFRK